MALTKNQFLETVKPILKANKHILDGWGVQFNKLGTKYPTKVWILREDEDKNRIIIDLSRAQDLGWGKDEVIREAVWMVQKVKDNYYPEEKISMTDEMKRVFGKDKSIVTHDKEEHETVQEIKEEAKQEKPDEHYEETQRKPPESVRTVTIVYVGDSKKKAYDITTKATIPESKVDEVVSELKQVLSKRLKVAESRLYTEEEYEQEQQEGNIKGGIAKTKKEDVSEPPSDPSILDVDSNDEDTDSSSGEESTEDDDNESEGPPESNSILDV